MRTLFIALLVVVGCDPDSWRDPPDDDDGRSCRSSSDCLPNYVCTGLWQSRCEPLEVPCETDWDCAPEDFCLVHDYRGMRRGSCAPESERGTSGTGMGGGGTGGH
jgi:hypothetical protein